MKGVVALAGVFHRLIVRAVRAIGPGPPGAPWGGERRRSRLVLIGRGLDRETATNRLRRRWCFPAGRQNGVTYESA
jgi:G3E family GTPase